MIKKTGIFLFFNLIFLNLFLFSLVSGEWHRTEPVKVITPSIICNRTSSFSQLINITIDNNGQWIQVPIRTIFNSSGNVGNCSFYNFPPYNIFCCPEGYFCNETNGICYKNTINYCQNLNTFDECIGQNKNYYGNLSFFEMKIPGWEFCEKDIPDGQFCSNYTLCECFWANNKCDVRSVKNRTCILLSNYSLVVSQEKCEFYLYSKEDRCSDLGRIRINYGASKYPTNASIPCQNFTKDYPCSSIVTLSFFDLTNFFLCLFLIGLVYIIFKK